MKRLGVSLILFFTTYIGIIANVRVLSIGISEYPDSSGWSKINAHNDVELIRSLFPNASSLENGFATRSGIERQLKALAKNVIPGDTVIIHFSGHGQQIITQASTEEVDRVDEALVPFDAGKRRTPSYHGENHLTDDAFGNAIDGLRRAVGPDGLVIALIDACHSDSMDKDAEGQKKEICRGTDEIFGAESMEDGKISSLRDAYHNRDATALKMSDDMSNAVYISACASDKRNYEVTEDGQGFGSLTYYFCKAYKSSGLCDLPALLSAIYSGMNNDKTLQFHGQVPSIRNTIGWKEPTEAEPTHRGTHDGSKQMDSSDGTKQTDRPSLLLTIFGIIGAALIVIFSGIWIARKRRI